MKKYNLKSREKANKEIEIKHTDSIKELELLTYQDVKLLLKKNSDFLIFAKDFYKLLSDANPIRKTNNRSLGNRRLDALARLLVGDETCVAVSYDRDHILISTNRKQHADDYAKFESTSIILAGSSNTDGYDLQDKHYLSFNGRPVIQVVGKPYHVSYDATSRTLKANKKSNGVTIEPSQHQVSFLPAIGIDSPLIEDKPTEPLLQENHKLPYDIELINTPFRGSIPFDPLKLRANMLIKHLATVYLVASTDKDDLKKEGGDIIDSNREKFLTQSLSWHASVLYGKDDEIRNYKATSFKSEIDNFVKLVAKDFLNFIIQKNENILSSTFVKIWRRSFLDKISREQVKVPEFIKSKPEMFLDKAKHYLIDLIKLENHVTTITKSATRSNSDENLIRILSKENPFEKTASVEVLDSKENLHAEMRLIDYFIVKEIQIPYLAISKLCCPYCHLVMQQLGITNISGSHGRIPSSWVLSSTFKNDKKLLAKFLGKNLAEKYELFEQEKIMTFKGKFYLKSDLILLIIQSLGTLNDKDLKELGIADKKIWLAGSELADESDDENESNDNSQSHYAKKIEQETAKKTNDSSQGEKTNKAYANFFSGNFSNKTTQPKPEELLELAKTHSIEELPTLEHAQRSIVEDVNQNNLQQGIEVSLQSLLSKQKLEENKPDDDGEKHQNIFKKYSK